MKITKSEREGVSIYTLSHDSGTSCEVSTFGATTLSLKSATNDEMLFVSKHSKFDTSKPIRGGIPLVFPIFNAGDIPKDIPDSSMSNVPHFKLPNHGFARREIWEYDSESMDSQQVTLTLKLTPNERTKSMWPYDFILRFQLILQATLLTTIFSVENTAVEVFPVQMLQHTYLTVPAIDQVLVHGLEGTSYMDQPKERAIRTLADDLAIDAETDLVFYNAPDTIQLQLNGTDHLKVSKKLVKKQMKEVRGYGSMEATVLSSDVVIWNPWRNKAAGMGDFGDEEYQNMVCIEPGSVSKYQWIRPTEQLELHQTIHLV